MACATCGNSILFGGKSLGARKYCSKNCLNADELGRQSDLVSDADANELAAKIKLSECPICQKPGDLEIFKSYFIYSIIIFTSWKTKPALSCRGCARKQQAKDLAGSLLLGWWGFPFGILITPIILVMNITTMFLDPSQKPPSKALVERARLLIAHDMLNQLKKI